LRSQLARGRADYGKSFAKDRGRKNREGFQKTAPKVTFIGIFVRQARVIFNDVSFVPPTCWNQRSARWRLTKIASRARCAFTRHKRSR